MTRLILKSVLAFVLASSLDKSSLNLSCAEEDVCTQGEYDESICQTEGIPYVCKAPFEEGPFTCIDTSLCCCESRDGLFSSPCSPDDVCCDGGCCDPKKSFCCGGGCCDQESETCCRGECVGLASNGITRAFPIMTNIVLALVFWCMVKNASENLRPGRLAAFMVLLLILGTVQVLVALSSWDCSVGVIVLVSIGGAEMAIGLLAVVFKMVQAKRAGMGVFAAFTLTKVVVLAVNSDQQVVGVAVADSRTMQVAQTKLGGRSSYGRVPQVQT